MTTTKKTERRWQVDDTAMVNEIITDDAREPVAFGLQFRVNPMTRTQLAAFRDALNEILEDVPERRIALLG